MCKEEKLNAVKNGSLAALLLIVAGMSAFLVYSGSALAQAKAVPSNKDCVKCHAGQGRDMAAGEGHMSVPCLGCHASHPPEKKKPVAQCTSCHFLPKTPRHHAELTDCLNCHNPHRPMQISLKGAGKDACLICHGLQDWLLRSNVSKHTALDCSRCHDVHRKIPQCVQCHMPHSGKITGGCNLCHSAHVPKLVAYPAEMPSNDCGLCHKIPADLLKATASKHKTLTCVRCHQTKHRFKPACNDCHGTPHPEGILAKFPECVMCHFSAHDLNNWPETATMHAAGETPTKQ